jgi:hypothetical protein
VSSNDTEEILRTGPLAIIETGLVDARTSFDYTAMSVLEMLRKLALAMEASGAQLNGSQTIVRDKFVELF